MTNVAWPEGTAVRRRFPSRSVDVDSAVPSTTTFAPGRGVPDASSTTRPTMAPVRLEPQPTTRQPGWRPRTHQGRPNQRHVREPPARTLNDEVDVSVNSQRSRDDRYADDSPLSVGRIEQSSSAPRDNARRARHHPQRARRDLRRRKRSAAPRPLPRSH